MTSETLGKYEIRSVLGKGAMGTVYAAWDPIISRQVAIKTVRLPDASDVDAQEELARFKREAQAAGRLTHPNIVGVYDYGETETVAYIVMEFVDGRTLKHILDSGERMTTDVIGRVMGDLLAGLSFSHARGVVHRDIKPANIIIVGGDGPGGSHNAGQAKIADFGIARIESSNLTQAGTIMGTPAYMSPEQFMGQTVDARTDLYSSGVVLFQMLTGERPFEGSMASIMHKALNTEPARPSDLSVNAPRALDRVVAQAMARRPEDRFASAEAFAAALREALAAAPMPSSSPSPSPSPLGPALPPGLGDLDPEATVMQGAAPPMRSAVVVEPPQTKAASRRSRVPLLAGVAVVLLVGLGAGGIFLLSGHAPEQPGSPDDSTVRSGSPVYAQSATPTGTGAATAAAPPAQLAATQPLVGSTPPVASQPPVAAPPTGSSSPAPGPGDGKPGSSVARAGRPDLGTLPVAVPATISPPPTATTALPTQATQTPAPIAAATSGAVPQPVATSSAPATAVTSPPTSLPPTSLPPIQAVPVTPPSTQTASNPTSAPTQAPPMTSGSTQTAAAGLTPEAMRRAVAASVHAATCAVVSGSMASNGSLSLRGAIGAGAPVQALLRDIRDAAPNAALDWSVAEAAGPYCGALNAVRSYARPFGSSSAGLGLSLKDGRTDLVADDDIDIHTTAPAFASYLQIDYFSTDGSVAHLRTANDGSAPVAPRSSQHFVGGQVFTPFGTDLIVAIAASAPLFGKDEALADTADAYVPQLQAALDAARSRKTDLSADVVVVRTRPKS